MQNHSVPTGSLEDLTTKCIRCGFCLEACPTFVATGEETESPRGRIYLIRSAEAGKIDWEAARLHVDRCMGCRACETACPSGVEYGAILELARERLETRKSSLKKRLTLWATTNPRVLRLVLSLGLVKSLPKRQAPVVWPMLDKSPLPPISGEAYLLEGCAMQVLFPEVHAATRRLLRRIGFEVKPVPATCCGALHGHNGYLEKGQAMAKAVLDSVPAGAPIIVDSAGCGSHLKDQGFANVFDASEFLSANGLVELIESSRIANDESRTPARIAYHDACHLAHGQKIRNQPRDLLDALPGVELVPLPESDTCCGSAGIYSALQPKLARQALDRKWANIEASGCDIVALGNPGCHAWIEQAARERNSSIRVVHTVEVIERRLSGLN